MLPKRVEGRRWDLEMTNRKIEELFIACFAVVMCAYHMIIILTTWVFCCWTIHVSKHTARGREQSVSYCWLYVECSFWFLCCVNCELCMHFAPAYTPASTIHITNSKLVNLWWLLITELWQYKQCNQGEGVYNCGYLVNIHKDKQKVKRTTKFCSKRQYPWISWDSNPRPFTAFTL